MRADIERWNRKYRDRTASTAITPDPLLVRHRALLADRGLCIDLAGGTGDNALYLQQLGYQALVVDGSEAGLRLCRHKARHHGLAPWLVAADLDRLPLPADTFDAVLVFHYLNRARIDDIRACLKPGGVLFFKTFNRRQARARPGFPEKYILRDGELDASFADLERVASGETPGADNTDYWIGRR